MTLGDFSVGIAPYGFAHSHYDGQTDAARHFTYLVNNIKYEVSLYVTTGGYKENSVPSFVIFRKYNNGEFQKGSMKLFETYQDIIQYIKGKEYL